MRGRGRGGPQGTPPRTGQATPHMGNGPGGRGRTEGDAKTTGPGEQNGRRTETPRGAGARDAGQKADRTSTRPAKGDPQNTPTRDAQTRNPEATQSGATARTPQEGTTQRRKEGPPRRPGKDDAHHGANRQERSNGTPRSGAEERRPDNRRQREAERPRTERAQATGRPRRQTAPADRRTAPQGARGRRPQGGAAAPQDGTPKRPRRQGRPQGADRQEHPTAGPGDRGRQEQAAGRAPGRPQSPPTDTGPLPFEPSVPAPPRSSPAPVAAARPPPCIDAINSRGVPSRGSPSAGHRPPRTGENPGERPGSGRRSSGFAPARPRRSETAPDGPRPALDGIRLAFFPGGGNDRERPGAGGIPRNPMGGIRWQRTGSSTRRPMRRSPASS